MNILIADDELMSLRLLKKTLTRVGYEVIAVDNGRLAAEQLCLADGPRIALLDWVMPELDGPAVCREVRRNHCQRHVHIILLTSKNTKQDIVDGLESGADDYLVKPFDPEELKARLRAGLRILQLEDNLVEAREGMRYKATHDDLTALFNRGMILDLLSRELIRTARDGLCTSVLLADIDHFKSINDQYGHVVGDEALREVARRLLQAVRSYDFVGRYGGEEFLVVLNNCEAARAMERAEELRRAVEHLPVQTSKGPIPITISVGAFASRDWEPLPVEDVLRKVDIALYSAKAGGRNCSRMAEPHPLALLTR
ncbi:MAG TPA: diguanylate cyclase [Acidisarcina sp.]